MSNVLKIDRSVRGSSSMSRGQIFRMDVFARSKEHTYNDSINIRFSRKKSSKSQIVNYTLGNGITKKSDGVYNVEFDTSLVRDCDDTIFCEVFPYGTGTRSLVYKIGLNDSSF